VPGKRGQTRRPDPAAESRQLGLALVRQHPLFAPSAAQVLWVQAGDHNRCPAAGWAVATSAGSVHLNPGRRGEPEEWAWVAAHCMLHLGFGHLAARHRAGWSAAAGAPADAGFDQAWNLAACLAVNRFLAHLKIGRPPEGVGAPTAYDHLVATMGTEDACASQFRARGVPLGLAGSGIGGAGGDLVWTGAAGPRSPAWPDLLAAGLTAAVAAAVDVAGGAAQSLTGGRGGKTRWRLAVDWFVASYPLLGGMAAAFTLVEDAELCRRNEISVAAISPRAAELYVNPHCGLGDDECRFVVAHELLHAGLRHDTRSGGRDPWLWNVACDYVINGWLVEMEVGTPPDGVLHDRALAGMSGEEVYDRIAADWRRYRKLATLRGVALGDVLPGPLAGAPDVLVGTDLDEFYRRALANGIEYHAARDRGLLPAGLVEEIRALAQPPVPWDVELARWFDDHFVPLERRRSYARASRRQSAAPDIPRPGRYVPQELVANRTFGVVLDTSGSMDSRLLGKALGAVASYAAAREVPAVRVVFCDARAHDSGWMEPLDIAGRVRVLGRGGTVLQPGVDLLEAAADFPKDGPILVITDAQCDRVRVRREHAFLIPAGAVLPFVPRGPVFRFA
jgi:predicted metal-dependent peptidase